MKRIVFALMLVPTLGWAQPAAPAAAGPDPQEIQIVQNVLVSRVQSKEQEILQLQVQLAQANRKIGELTKQLADANKPPAGK